MAEEQRLNDDLDSFAAAMSGLSPRPGQLNRDRLMYEAGRSVTMKSISSNRAHLRLWQLTTGLSTVAAATLAVLLVPLLRDHTIDDQRQSVASQSRAKSREVRIVVEPTPSVQPNSSIDRPAFDRGMTYIGLRNFVLLEGIESLPLSRSTGTCNSNLPATTREFIESLNNSRDFGG